MLDKLKTKKQLSKKVLLAEDNEVNQLVFKGMIHELGFVVDVAENGKHAIDMWKQANYDVIFMDVQMPVMDGLEATRLIRSMENTGEHQPIIAVTANAFEEDEQACLAVGMDAYLTKPLEIKLLQETMVACLQTA